jgi:hypothetical protein
MQEPKRGVWLSFQLATEKVERSRGVSEGKAQKDLLDACASDKLRWRNRPVGGPDVLDVDLRRWLNPPKQGLGKQPLIMEHLAKMFPDCRVPDHCQRKGLLAELGKRDPVLKSLDHKTLKRAIDRYNSVIDGKQS